ncbi:hypothetical protein ES703_21972 [subsurface metagenome]
MGYPRGNPVVGPINKAFLRVPDTNGRHMDIISPYIPDPDGYINPAACNSTAWSVYCDNIRESACSNISDFPRE